jgi:DNA primase
VGRADEKMMTSSGHHNANWLNDDKCGYREMRLAAYFHQDGNTRRNRVIHRDGGKRIKPTKPIRRHIRPTRRKKLLQSSPHNAIALLLLELYVMTPTISSFTLPSAQLHIISNAASSKSSPSIIYSSFPQHDEYNDNNEQSNINPQFYRQNYNQLGVSSTTNNDRQRMIMNSINQNGGSGDDDEWESYLNLNFDGDGEVVIENDHVHAVQSSFDDGDLSSGRRKEVEAIDRTSIQEPKGEERSNSRSSMDQRDIYDVNANLRNGEQTPRQQLLQRNAAIAAQLRSKGNATNGESIAVDDRKEAIYRSGINGAVAKGIEGQVPPTNAKPMSARKSSDDVNGFRQQFITRTSEDSNEKDPATTPSTSTKRKRVTAEEIEYIKSTLPLTDVIETYNLKGFTRTNTHLAKACCPFHDDNNPSMSIDDNRGLYKCFACGAGGDVFNFIREYDYIENKRSGEDKMGYMQAVEYAAREFGDDRLVSGWNFGKSNDVMLYEGMSEEAKEKLIERQRKRDRIRQANTAAAAFYTKCLVTLSTAGKARAHLRSRNISPESVREFALGYAPDCYYGDEASSSKSWGEGSLVSYLAKMEFTPDEIVEAGLAVRTKKKIQTEDIEQQQPNNADAANDYSTLMDRFRSRLIVPILDDSGQHVIAFGGRHLESISTSEDAKSEQFTPSKYINSPESLVFVKKNVLFNKYKAQEALNARSSETNSSPSFTFHSHKGVVIVEGYFDAIALSNVGVKNVVASMGTALPPEQLLMAAEMGKVPGGT